MLNIKLQFIPTIYPSGHPPSGVVVVGGTGRVHPILGRMQANFLFVLSTSSNDQKPGVLPELKYIGTNSVK